MKNLIFFIFFQLLLVTYLSGCVRTDNYYSPPPKPLTSPPFVKTESSFPVTVVKSIASPVIKPPMDKPLIVIDAGHGGEDYGTHSSTKPKYQEKYLNMSTALLLRDYLQSLGYKTVLTRSQDVFVTLENRALFANAQKPLLFVSVHYNSAPSKQAEGIEVYYYKSEENKPRTQESKKLAEKILQKVIANTQAKSRGVKHGNYAVIRETTMPAILIEGGFLTNEQEMDKIKDPAYLKQIAWGIAQGIHEYTQIK